MSQEENVHSADTTEDLSEEGIPLVELVEFFEVAGGDLLEVSGFKVTAQERASTMEKFNNLFTDSEKEVHTLA